MQKLSSQGQQRIADMAQRYGVSADAVMALLQALLNGQGTMAQFNHPELGGAGQWMRGGMTMVGDMFNYSLKATVDGLCSELSRLLSEQPDLMAPASQSQSQGASGYGPAVSLFVPSGSGAGGNWWPAELGAPSASGAQNNIRYAYFPAARRLAVEINGRVSVYDTLDHQIGGVSQQQGNDAASLTFTSQSGLIRVADLPVVGGDGSARAGTESPVQAPAVQPAATGQPAEEDVIAKIERLADLRKQGILSEAEFAAKKAELLSRL